MPRKLHQAGKQDKKRFFRKSKIFLNAFPFCKKIAAPDGTNCDEPGGFASQHQNICSVKF